MEKDECRFRNKLPRQPKSGLLEVASETGLDSRFRGNGGTCSICVRRSHFVIPTSTILAEPCRRRDGLRTAEPFRDSAWQG